MIDRIVKDVDNHVFESKTDILEKLNYYRQLSQAGLHNLSESEIAELKESFSDFLNIELAFFADAYPRKLFRITNNKYLTGGQKVKLQKITDLIGPPIGLSSIGRCNLKGESVFYSALDIQTAIWETQPEVDDYITVSEWKIKEGQKIYTHSIFHPEETNLSKESQVAYQEHLKEISKIRPDLGEIFIEIIKFVCEEFMKPVKSGEKINYLFSSIISSKFLQSPPDANGFNIEAISYPSTKRDHKVTNLAILNSLALDKLDLTAVTIWNVAETNYDLVDKDRGDLIKISALQTHGKEFDFVNNKVIYDLQRELKDAMELHKLTGK